MQVLCMLTPEPQCDVECPCCHQKYVVYYSRPGSPECQAALEAVRMALLEHHVVNPLPSAHPGEAFNVPAWHGSARYSGAALLSGAPMWEVPRGKAAALTLVPTSQQRRVS